MRRLPPSSTRTDNLFPHKTPFLCEDDAARREMERLPADTGGDDDAGPVLQVNPFYLRLVVGHDTEALAMAVERIHQGAAAAEEEGVGAPQVQGDRKSTRLNSSH